MTGKRGKVPCPMKVQKNNKDKRNAKTYTKKGVKRGGVALCALASTAWNGKGKLKKHKPPEMKDPHQGGEGLPTLKRGHFLLSGSQ